VIGVQNVATELHALKKAILNKVGMLYVPQTQAMIEHHIVADDNIRASLLAKVGNANDGQGNCICQGLFVTTGTSSVDFTWYYHFVQELGMGSSHSYAKFDMRKMMKCDCADIPDKFEKLFILSWVVFDSSFMATQNDCHYLELIVPFDLD
jgi:hypothetical protein